LILLALCQRLQHDFFQLKLLAAKHHKKARKTILCHEFLITFPFASEIKAALMLMEATAALR